MLPPTTIRLTEFCSGVEREGSLAVPVGFRVCRAHYPGGDRVGRTGWVTSSGEFLDFTWKSLSWRKMVVKPPGCLRKETDDEWTEKVPQTTFPKKASPS